MDMLKQRRGNFQFRGKVSMTPQADHPNCSRHRDVTRKTCDPIHLLYFVTPVLDLIQVIGRNAS